MQAGILMTTVVSASPRATKMQRYKKFNSLNRILLYTIFMCLENVTLTFYIPVISSQQRRQPSAVTFRAISRAGCLLSSCTDYYDTGNCPEDYDNRLGINGNGTKNKNDVFYPLNDPVLQFQLEEQIKSFPFDSDASLARLQSPKISQESKMGSLNQQQSLESPLASRTGYGSLGALNADQDQDALIIPLPALKTFIFHSKRNEEATIPPFTLSPFVKFLENGPSPANNLMPSTTTIDSNKIEKKFGYHNGETILKNHDTVDISGDDDTIHDGRNSSRRCDRFRSSNRCYDSSNSVRNGRVVDEKNNFDDSCNCAYCCIENTNESNSLYTGGKSVYDSSYGKMPAYADCVINLSPERVESTEPVVERDCRGCCCCAEDPCETSCCTGNDFDNTNESGNSETKTFVAIPAAQSLGKNSICNLEKSYASNSEKSYVSLRSNNTVIEPFSSNNTVIGKTNDTSAIQQTADKLEKLENEVEIQSLGYNIGERPRNPFAAKTDGLGARFVYYSGITVDDKTNETHELNITDGVFSRKSINVIGITPTDSNENIEVNNKTASSERTVKSESVLATVENIIATSESPITESRTELTTVGMELVENSTSDDTKFDMITNGKEEFNTVSDNVFSSTIQNTVNSKLDSKLFELNSTLNNENAINDTFEVIKNDKSHLNFTHPSSNTSKISKIILEATTENMLINNFDEVNVIVSSSTIQSTTLTVAELNNSAITNPEKPHFRSRNAFDGFKMNLKNSKLEKKQI